MLVCPVTLKRMHRYKTDIKRMTLASVFGNRLYSMTVSDCDFQFKIPFLQHVL